MSPLRNGSDFFIDNSELVAPVEYTRGPAQVAKVLESVVETKWLEETGERPEDSEFTVIIPIHDEEKSLPTLLWALNLAEIPTNSKVKIMFGLNDSKDGSRKLIEEYMASFDTDIERILSSSEDFLGGNTQVYRVGEEVLKTKMGNIEIFCFNSHLASKANVLNVANVFSKKNGIPLVVNLDANNFPEPASFRAIYKYALEHFNPDREDYTPIFGTNMIYKKRAKGGYQRTLEELMKIDPRRKDRLVGWMVGWNSDWLESIGGWPLNVAEDYVMSVITRHKGFNVGHALDARVWGYEANNTKDLVLQLMRYYRGMFQAFWHFPELRETIISENPELRGRGHHVVDLVSKVIRSPKGFGYMSKYFLIKELAIFSGKWLNRFRNTETSWPDIKSTK